MADFYVGSTRTYETINSAYSAASHGDTIFIDEGIYNEKIEMVGKLVNLVGNTAYPDEERVKINAPSSGDYFTIKLEWNSTTSVNVYLEGLSIQTFRYTSTGSQAVRIDGDYATRISGMNVIFNKCTLRPNSNDTSCLVWGEANTSSTYRSASSVNFFNCKLYLHSSYKHVFSSTIPIRWPASSRVLYKSILDRYFTYFTSSDIRYYDFEGGYLDWIYISKEFPSYGPKYSNYLNPTDNNYKFSGIIAEQGTPVSRELRVFRSDNDAFLTSTYSSIIDGSYEVTVPFNVYHYIICMDASANPYYNDLIEAKCLPELLNNVDVEYIDINFSLANTYASSKCVTGWTRDLGYIQGYSGGWQGSYSFGAPGTGDKSIYQTIDLNALGATSSGIDSEQYAVKLVVWSKVKYVSGLNNLYIKTQFYDADEVQIEGLYSVGYKNVTTSWEMQNYTRTIVSGTRYMDVTILVDNDSYSQETQFDAITPSIRIPDALEEFLDGYKYVDLVNSSAEFNNMSGWANEGTYEFAPVVRSTDEYRFYSGIGGTSGESSIMSQRIDLYGHKISPSAIVDGLVDFSVTAAVLQYDMTASNKNYFGIRSVDEFSTTSGTVWQEVAAPSGSEEFETINVTLASGTRYVDVMFKSLRPARMYVDYIQPKITISGTDSVLEDDFTGPNGDLPAVEFWQINEPIWGSTTYLDSNVTIQNNELNVPANSSESRGGVMSNFYVSGDFSIQVDVDATNCNSTSYMAAMYFWKDEPNRTLVTMQADDGGRFRTHSSIGDVWQTDKSITRTNAYGTLKLVRFGATIIAKVKDGDGPWQIVGKSTSTTDDGRVVLYQDHGSATTGTTVFDNFKVNRGTVLWPRLTDYFSGSSGSLPDSDLWTLSLGGTNTATIDNNRLKQYDTGGASLNYVKSNFRLVGDFDLQFDTFDIGTPSGGNIQHGLYIYMPETDDMYATYTKKYTSGYSVSCFTKRIDSSWSEVTGEVSWSLPATFRVKRVGNTTYKYTWHTSGWNLRGSHNYGSAPDFEIWFFNQLLSGATTYTSYKDNFKVISGTVVF